MPPFVDYVSRLSLHVLHGRCVIMKLVLRADERGVVQIRPFSAV